jgi:hypothetical protein
MDHMEMVEKLRAKANVSYEEARRALEENDWDMLDALVMLEGEGKVKDAEEKAEYTTQETADKSFFIHPDAAQMKSGFARVWDWIKTMVRKGNANQLVVSRKGEEMIAMPITVAVLILVFLRVPHALLPMLVLLFVSLCLGVRYSFRGPDIGAKVNDAMNRAQDKAAGVVHLHADGQKDAGREENRDENKAE